MNPKNSNDKPLLTRRQLQVLALKASDLTDRGVARELRISRSTVRKHLHSARQRLGVNSTVAAVAKCRYSE